jgi:hypothetical protein
MFESTSNIDEKVSKARLGEAMTQRRVVFRVENSRGQLAIHSI